MFLPPYNIFEDVGTFWMFLFSFYFQNLRADYKIHPLSEIKLTSSKIEENEVQSISIPNYVVLFYVIRYFCLFLLQGLNDISLKVLCKNYFFYFCNSLKTLLLVPSVP